MLPASITLQNYRSFAAPVALQLRAITLLFGVNNSGKSALLRALPLTADACAPRLRSPLDLKSPAAGTRANFRTLRWRHPAPAGEQQLGIKLSWADGCTVQSAQYFIQQRSEWNRLIIDRLQLTGSALSLQWLPLPKEQRSPALTYTDANMQPFGSVRFEGLVPTSYPASTALAALQQQLMEFHGAVQWMRAVRSPLARTFSISHVQTWRMQPDGADVAEVLGGDPEILREVSSWY